MDNTAAWLDTARTAARSAGRFLLDEWRKDLVINEAHQHDLKIQLDVDTQALLTRAILERHPGHAILGEEGGEGGGGAGMEWILDPIDGTVNLAYGIPHFCISLALRRDDTVLLGVIYDPVRDELFEGVRGGGAFLNGRPIHASKRADLKEAIVSLGFSKTGETVQKCLELYTHYAPRVRKMRAMGSAALDMAYIAAGRYDAYIEQGIKIWDIAAGWVILEEAGGKVQLTPRPQPHHYHIKATNGVMEFPLD